MERKEIQNLNRTRMTRMERIYADKTKRIQGKTGSLGLNPCKSAPSASSAFHGFFVLVKCLLRR